MIFVISPHIDDAILSVGGFINQLIERKNELMIVYVFSVSNWTNPDSAIKIRGGNNETSISGIRQNEEMVVAKHLNHCYTFLDFKDYPLRDSANKLMELELFKQIKDKLITTLSKSDLCFFPIGRTHPDHKIIGKIGQRLFEMGFNINFYEDMPYSADNSFNYERFHSYMLSKSLVPETIAIDINIKLSLLKLYKSQMSNVWLNCVKSYSYNLVDNKHYERIWKNLIK